MSISTILVVVVILIMFVGGLVYFVSALRRRSSARVKLRSVVTIYPSGESAVEWNPDISGNTISHMKLAIQYTAKIAHVISSEPQEVQDVLYKLLESIIAWEGDEESPFQNEEDFTLRLQHIRDVLAKSTSDSFYDKADKFTVELVEGESGEFVVNHLLLPGLAVNVPISALLLLSEVANSGLTTDEKLVFQHALKGLILSLRYEPIRSHRDLRLAASRITSAFNQTRLVQSMKTR